MPDSGGSPTAVTTVLKTTDWNTILDNVNTAIAGCGGTALPHVTDPHLWSYTDIINVQNALKAACSTNTFTTPVGPPYLWLQKIIDEINTARVKGCCNPRSTCACNASTGQYSTFLYSAGPTYARCVAGTLAAVNAAISAWVVGPGAGTSAGHSATGATLC